MKRIYLSDQQLKQKQQNSQFSYDDPYESFLYALNCSETKRQYPKRLKVVFDYFVSINELEETQLENQCKEVVSKTLQNPQWLTSSLMKFIIFQNERIQRKEIQKIIEYPDRRIKPLILCMVSGGFRLGAWDYLKWKHVIPMKNKEGEIICAKLITYGGEPEEYYCFITPEAYNALKNWMDYRHEAGEEITGESWLMRNMWQTTEFIYGAKWGLVKYPKKLETIYKINLYVDIWMEL
jgi:integrase